MGIKLRIGKNIINIAVIDTEIINIAYNQIVHKYASQPIIK